MPDTAPTFELERSSYKTSTTQGLHRKKRGRWSTTTSKEEESLRAGSSSAASSEAGLDGAKELLSLVSGLETTMSNLGGGIDELELDLLEGVSGDLGSEGLSEDNDSLSGSEDGSLEHDEVLLDGSVSSEATHGGDGLLGKVELGGGGVEDLLSSLVLDGLAESVDLLVGLSTAVVTLLTSTGDGP